MKCLDISNDLAENQLKDSINNKVVLVLFHSDMCGYCKMMMPAFKQFHTDQPNRENVLISKIEKQHMNRFPLPVNIQGYPTLKIYKNNQEVDTYDDEQSYNDRSPTSFAKFLKKHLQNNMRSKSRGMSRGMRRGMSRGRSRSRSMPSRRSIYSRPRSMRSFMPSKSASVLANPANNVHLDLLRRRSKSNFDKNMRRLTSKLNLKTKSLPLKLTGPLSLKQPNTLKLKPSKKKKKKKSSAAKKKKSTLPKKKKKKSSKKKKGTKK